MKGTAAKRSSSLAGYRGARPMRALGILSVAAILATTAASLLIPEPASAYTPLFRKFLQRAVPDPCDQLNVGPGGGLVTREWDPGQPSVKRYVTLLCGPKLQVPPASILLADDQIWQFGLGQGGPAPQHMLLGGVPSLPWNTAISTKQYPFLKGPDGHAPGINRPELNAELLEVITAAIEALLKLKVTFEVAECVLGSLESAGFSCLQLLAGVGLENALGLANAAAVLVIYFVDFIESRIDMNNSDWFYWSDNRGFWDGFGDINPDGIDPSITMTGVGTTNVRIGVVLSNVALDQGPDFGLPASSPGAAQTRALARTAARMKARQGKSIVGTNHADRLFGSNRRDLIHGRGRDDLIRGRGGDDTILQGARGNDRVYGGRGDDNLDGHRGQDTLGGGPGDDQIVDVFGPTFVSTGAGRDLVVVRDGQGDDRVDCHGSRRVLIRADRSDRIAASCEGRVIRSGPRMRVGRGYDERPKKKARY